MLQKISMLSITKWNTKIVALNYIQIFLQHHLNKLTFMHIKTTILWELNFKGVVKILPIGKLGKWNSLSRYYIAYEKLSSVS